jgi:hypothetical protein
MLPRRALLLGVIAVTFATYGCTVINAALNGTSNVLSATGNAVAGVLHAIADSSGSGNGSSARNDSYERDLREYTAMFMRSGGTQADFLRGVTRIAENHGIAHWEAEVGTPFAIGQGMREANVSEAEMRAFCNEIGVETPAAKLALKGWETPPG